MDTPKASKSAASLLWRARYALDEADGFETLKAFAIQDGAPDEDLNTLLKMAVQIFDAPLGLISLTDGHHQWFKARHGITLAEPPLENTFCGYAYRERSLFVVSNALEDPRFADHPLVKGQMGIRAYAGAPLVTSDGAILGTICVLDRRPREFSPEQLGSLQALSRQVVSHYERRRLAAALELRERFLSAVLENLPDLVSYLDTELRYRYINRGYPEWFQREATQILGRRVPEVVGDAVFEIVRPRLEKAVRGEPQEFELEVPHSDNDSDPKPRSVFVSYMPDRLADGHVAGIFVVVRDLTRIKQAEKQALEQGVKLRRALDQALEREKELAAAQAQLVATAKMASLGEMAAGVAHEINNPVAIIHARAALLKGTKTDLSVEKMKQGLDVISRMAERIATIVKGLRAFSQNSDHEPMSETSVQRILDDTWSFCRDRFQENGVELRVRGEKDTRLVCRPIQISQVLLNLLGNAFDSVEGLEEKWVELDVKAQEKNVSISVTDSGVGISEAVAQRMMEPFFTTKEVGRGTGLGLSISKGIVESHEGRLYYDASSTHTRFVTELGSTS